MPNIEAITGILVTLHVADTQALYVMLNSDGAIHRMGNGTESNTEQDLFIGTTHCAEFEHFRKLITPQLLQWLGSYADPHPQGKLCELTIGFRTEDGKEVFSRWTYGTSSQGPPPEICEFVRAAVNITQPWYADQLKLRSR